METSSDAVRYPMVCLLRVFVTVWKFSVILTLACSICACHSQETRPNGILILLDTARADRFSSYGYTRQTTPNIDRFAENGIIFLNHFSQGTHTLREIPNIFYSRYFFRPLFPGNPDIPFYNPVDLIRVDDPQSISLPKALSTAGYWTCIISAHAWIKPNTPFARQFDEIHDLSTELKYPEEEAYPDAQQVVDYAIRWIQRNQDKQYFLYLHFMDQHFPHFLKEDARSILKEQGLPVERPEKFSENGWLRNDSEPLTAVEKAYLDALYDGSLIFTDRHLGRLFSYLGESLQDTVVGISSDHGEELMEAPDRFGHGHLWYEAVAHVPFILSYPRKVQQHKATFFSENVDIMPTFLGLMGVPMPAGKKTDGIDLSAVLAGELKPKDYAVMLRGIRNSRYKCYFGSQAEPFLQTEDGAFPESGVLFDLEEDPLELVNLWDLEPQVVKQMALNFRKALRDPLLRFEAAVSKEQPEAKFAISVKAFRYGNGDSAKLEKMGWDEFTERQRGNAYVLGSPGAKPLQVTFQVPDGIYSVQANAVGLGKILLVDEKREIPVKTRILPDREEIIRLDAEEISLGFVRISSRRFQVTLFSGNEHPFLLRYFEFTPIQTTGDELPEMDEATKDQLKALGYIN